MKFTVDLGPRHSRFGYLLGYQLRHLLPWQGLGYLHHLSQYKSPTVLPVLTQSQCPVQYNLEHSRKFEVLGKSENYFIRYT
jgi:hypothetical protein